MSAIHTTIRIVFSILSLLVFTNIHTGGGGGGEFHDFNTTSPLAYIDEFWNDGLDARESVVYYRTQ